MVEESGAVEDANAENLYLMGKYSLKLMFCFFCLLLLFLLFNIKTAYYFMLTLEHKLSIITLQPILIRINLMQKCQFL